MVNSYNSIMATINLCYHGLHMNSMWGLFYAYTTPVKWLSVEMPGDIGHQPVSGGGIVIRIGDARVEVEPGCDLILLREVVQALATLC